VKHGLGITENRHFCKSLKTVPVHIFMNLCKFTTLENGLPEVRTEGGLEGVQEVGVAMSPSYRVWTGPGGSGDPPKQCWEAEIRVCTLCKPVQNSAKHCKSTVRY